MAATSITCMNGARQRSYDRCVVPMDRHCGTGACRAVVSLVAMAVGCGVRNDFISCRAAWLSVGLVRAAALAIDTGHVDTTSSTHVAAGCAQFCDHSFVSRPIASDPGQQVDSSSLPLSVDGVMHGPSTVTLRLSETGADCIAAAIYRSLHTQD